MNDKRKKEFAATIKHLSEEIGKKPEVILENVLRKVLLKTPIPALQKMGIVSGEPDEDIDVEASKKNVAEEIAADLAAEATCGRMRRVSFIFNAVLDYRLARGLGADFSTPFLWRKKDARQFLLQLLVMRKELAKIAKKGADPSHPTFGVTPACDIMADVYVKKIDQAFEALDGKYHGLKAADVKAFAAKQKAEAEKIARKAAKRKPFEGLSLNLYYSLCYLVLSDANFADDTKLSFVPYPLLTREEVIRLLALRFKEIKNLQTEMNGPREEGLPKSYYREEISEIRLTLKQFPADLVKAAKAQSETA